KPTTARSARSSSSPGRRCPHCRCVWFRRERSANSPEKDSNRSRVAHQRKRRPEGRRKQPAGRNSGLSLLLITGVVDTCSQARLLTRGIVLVKSSASRGLVDETLRNLLVLLRAFDVAGFGSSHSLLGERTDHALLGAICQPGTFRLPVVLDRRLVPG